VIVLRSTAPYLFAVALISLYDSVLSSLEPFHTFSYSLNVSSILNMHRFDFSSLPPLKHTLPGLKSMFLGLGATSAGYFLQGGFKFGFYEYFKANIPNLTLLSDEQKNIFRIPMLVVASGIAETIASFALCPLEVTKIYMQANPEAAGINLGACMKSIVRKVSGTSLLNFCVLWVL
jgi:peptidoglycan biosynthesis protein MviN/MurJ (putative lipid II flippase)